LSVYAVKDTGEFDCNCFNQSLFEPFGDKVKQAPHRRLPEQAGQQRNERHADNGNAAARHKLSNTQLNVAGGGV